MLVKRGEGLTLKYGATTRMVTTLKMGLCRCSKSKQSSRLATRSNYFFLKPSGGSLPQRPNTTKKIVHRGI